MKTEKFDPNEFSLIASSDHLQANNFLFVNRCYRYTDIRVTIFVDQLATIESPADCDSVLKEIEERAKQKVINYLERGVLQQGVKVCDDVISLSHYKAQNGL